MDKQASVYLYIGILLSNHKEQINDTCIMDRSYRHCSELKKLDNSIFMKHKNRQNYGNRSQ